MASNGWGAFGAALGGNSDAARLQGEYKGAEIAQVIERAKQERNVNLGRQQAAQAAYASGNNDLGNALLRGETLSSTTEGQLHQQHMKWGDDAMALASGDHPDLNRLNTILMAMKGAPVDLTKIEGNQIINPMQTPDVQNIHATDIGRAMIAENEAQAGQHNAAAAASYASAARQKAGISADKAANYVLETDASGRTIRVNKLTGEAAPVMVAGDSSDGPPIMEALKAGLGGKGGGAGTGILSSEEIKAAFGNGQEGVDGKKYNRFLRYMQNGGMTNQHEALLRYSNDQHVGDDVTGGASTTALPPAAVPPRGAMDAIASALGIGGKAAPGVPSPIDPASQHVGTDAKTPTTEAEYNALPPGTLWRDPTTGVLKRKKGN